MPEPPDQGLFSLRVAVLRTGVLGVCFIATLAGFGTVVFPYTVLRAFVVPVNPHEIKALQTQLQLIREQVRRPPGPVYTAADSAASPQPAAAAPPGSRRPAFQRCFDSQAVAAVGREPVPPNGSAPTRVPSKFPTFPDGAFVHMCRMAACAQLRGRSHMHACHRRLFTL